MDIENTRTVSLREHLSAFSAVELPLEAAALHYVAVAGRFGPTSTVCLAGIRRGLEFLLPVKSFFTRYLLLDSGSWTLLVTDARREFCYVDAYALSRATGCRGIGVSLLPDRRRLHLFEGGNKIREVHSESDPDRWYYREVGQLQECEDPREYTKRRKSDRLTPEAVAGCWRRFTGQALPRWETMADTPMIGVERSTAEVTRAIISYEMAIDLQF